MSSGGNYFSETLSQYSHNSVIVVILAVVSIGHDNIILTKLQCDLGSGNMADGS